MASAPAPGQIHPENPLRYVTAAGYWRTHTDCVRKLFPPRRRVTASRGDSTTSNEHVLSFSTAGVSTFVDVQTWRGSLHDPDRAATVIGTGSVVGADILGVFIHPASQHKGYGKSLMQALEDTAVANGISEVVISVSLPSRRFYERLGYEIIENRTIDVGGAQKLDYWEAKKSLIKGES